MLISGGAPSRGDYHPAAAHARIGERFILWGRNGSGEGSGRTRALMGKSIGKETEVHKEAVRSGLVGLSHQKSNALEKLKMIMLMWHI